MSVKDHLLIVVKPQPCATTRRMYKLPEADSMENITTACVRHVRGKVTHNCLTNCWVLVVCTQAGALYSNSQNLCITFPSKFHSLYVPFNRWLSLTRMSHLTSSSISLWFLPELDALHSSVTGFPCEVSVPSYGTFLERNFSWSFMTCTLLFDHSQNFFPLRYNPGLHQW